MAQLQTYKKDEVAEIPVDTGSLDAWNLMLGYIYSDRIVITTETLHDLTILSQKYHLTHLEVVCENTHAMKVVPPSSFNYDLKNLLENKIFSDCTIEVEGRFFFSHRFILCARSSYFRR